MENSELIFLRGGAYKVLSKEVIKMQAVAVTDLRVSEVALSNTPGDKDSQKIVLYGTAIVPRDAIPTEKQD